MKCVGVANFMQVPIVVDGKFQVCIDESQSIAKMMPLLPRP